jgi:hypothetical protein
MGDDYFGASLMSFCDLFDKFDYVLVCCNSHTGSNAFFVDAKYEQFFSDVPKDVNLLYFGPPYQLYHRYGHPQSMRTIEKIINYKGH